MLLLAAAMLAFAPSSRPAVATVQATATIRIVSAVRLKLDGSRNLDAPAVRATIVRARDGSTQTAKLIEFQ